MTVEWPDTEGAVRTYLRAHTDIVAAVSTRVFFALPDDPTWPLITLATVGGFEDTSDAPLDQALIQFDGWGAFHLDGDGVEILGRPNKAGATTVRRALRQALTDLTHQPATVTVGAATVRLAGAVVQSDLYVPDPADGRPRYAVTAQITARQLASA